MASHNTKKKAVFQHMDTDQCRTTSRRIQVNVKRQIPDNGLMRRNMLQETMTVWCSHTIYSGDGIKLVISELFRT